MYKHSFGNTSPDWSLTMAWPSGTWYVYSSDSLLISSSIYSFFTYGSSTKYAYMIVISLIDHSITARYKSSITCDYKYSSGASGDYVAAYVYCSSRYLFIFNRVTNIIDIREFTVGLLNGVGLEIRTNR